MSRVSPVQTSFNGGALSKRLHGRIDQTIYDISVSEMVGFAPLVEGGMEAMPGTIHVDAAPGPCRLFRFEQRTTQGHVLELSEGAARIFTNDSLIATIASPYSFAEVEGLRTHQSFDVLYCFLRSRQTRQFYRDDATTFGFEGVSFENGPFERTNANEGVRVSASATIGNVTLFASADIFEEGDVGGLFRMEAEDFGDTTMWEPYMTVVRGQLLTWAERVYRVIGGNNAAESLRTGSAQPVHVKGVEWDGIGKGTDINGDPAAGVQLEYVHDRYGIVELTGFTNARTMTGTVRRNLPFSSVGGAGGVGTTGGNYTYGGGYYQDEFEPYDPPVGAAAYSYGTWRWAFGAFSDRRGWPEAGCIWNERLCLAKDGVIYGSVVGDLTNHAEFNELGEASADMAFIIGLDDPNPILHLVAEDRLLAFTSGGVHAIGASNAASGPGPGNLRAERQNDAGAAAPQPVSLNSRTLYIDRSRRRIYETDFDPARRVEQELDLTRYARDKGNPGFRAIAPQQHPMNHIWFARGDGTLACAVYQPEERVLGFCERPFAPDMYVRDAVTITDPAGEFDQVWLAAEYGGEWHILRMAPWRLDGQSDDTGCVVDMAGEYEGVARADFQLAHLPNTKIAVVADGQLERLTTDGEGRFTIAAASRVVAGLEFPAWVEGLPREGGGDNGPAMAKKARLGRSFISVLNARGLALGLAGEDLKPMQDLSIDRDLNDPQADQTAYLFLEAPGPYTRRPAFRVERISPFQSTILAWGGDMHVEKL